MSPIPVAWDDENGVRRLGEITHYDDGAGVRHEVNEAGRLDLATPEPPPPPEPETPRYLGMYGSSLSDDALFTMFGRYPEIAASYWQLGNTNNTLAFERTRAEKGISSHCVIAPKDGFTATSARDYINGLVTGTAFYVDFFSDWLNSLQVASLSQTPGTPKMIAFPMCEPEVLRQQGSLASLQTERGTIQATMERIGEYHQVMYDLMATICPNVLRGLWLGGASGQYQNINWMLAQIDSGVQRAGTDPYQNSAYNGPPSVAWTSRVNAFRSPSGSHYAHWVRWGSPPVILTETGISHYNPNTNVIVNSDALKAQWISEIRASQDAMDIERVVYFNSAGPNGHQRLDSYVLDDAGSPLDGNTMNYGPLARAAFSTELSKSPGPDVTTITAIGTPVTIGDPDTTGVIKEISGIVCSRKNSASGARLMWGANDQGTGPYLYAFRDAEGNNLKHRLEITGLTVTTQVQFEDLSKCKMPDGSEGLMVGRIGDGYTHFIRVAEPTVNPSGTYTTSTAPGTEFHFVNQSTGNNHEAFFVDPMTWDLYLIEKTGVVTRPRTCRVWRIPAATLGPTGRPSSNAIGLGTAVATIKVDIESTGSGAPTAADISDDGRFIMVGNYQELMIWRRDPDTESVETALKRGGASTTPSDPHVRLWVPSGAPNTLGSESYCFDHGDNPTVGFSMGESAAGTSALKQFTFTYGTA
jgi:hypothetical protein